MTNRKNISAYILTLTFSLLMLIGHATPAQAQLKMFRLEKDSIPFFRGFQVSFDLVGPAMLLLGDRGEYEGALRINLHDQWFPIFEMGLGRAKREDDEVTHLTYKTSAPYFRIGMDWNILRNKHQANRLFVGFRYAFTTYKVDILHEDLFGIDAKVYGPLHLGWSVRYKRRVAHKDGDLGNVWYVPGFGINDKDNLAANFNVIFDI